MTFAAGLACEGLVPFCTIYSTFMQRGYDQIVHDVSLQKLPGACVSVARTQWWLRTAGPRVSFAAGPGYSTWLKMPTGD